MRSAERHSVAIDGVVDGRTGRPRKKEVNISRHVLQMHSSLPRRPWKFTRHPPFNPLPSANRKQKKPPTRLKKPSAAGSVATRPHYAKRIAFRPYFELAVWSQGQEVLGVFCADACTLLLLRVSMKKKSFAKITFLSFNNKYCITNSMVNKTFPFKY